jgi:N-acetylmuramoyl-L-alanine amidase
VTPRATLSPRPRATARPAGPPTPEAGAERTFKVQVGAFGSRANADDRVEALKAAGFTPYVVREGALFKVRVGAFRTRGQADEMAGRLRARGFQVTIVQ